MATYLRNLDMVGRTFLDRYETVRLLGEGGMGRVYLARQLDLGRQVVVKVMHEHIAADPKFCERFQRETLLMARFQHPYVVTLYDASLNDPEGPFIVMEYIKGVSLETLMQKNGRFSPHRFARIMSQLCEALQAAHSDGIVHRDLKPANLMVVDADSPYEKIKVMDFGLAKMLPRHNKLDNPLDTNADFAVGTPGYISPEQVRGDDVDHRADLYSMGVLLYEVFTGRLPFLGTETMDVLLAHAQDEPPTFDAVGLDSVIPPAVEHVVMACLAKDPNDRPQSARGLAEMYECALYQRDDEDDEDLAMSTMPMRELKEIRDSVSEETPASALKTPLPHAVATDEDPSAVVHRLEAWMHESIAAYKLRGFIDEVGGEIIESIPGRIRVRLGGKDSNYIIPGSGPFSWVGLGGKSTVDIELRLQRDKPGKQSMLSITVIMKPTNRKLAVSPAWRKCCNEIFCDLRGFLMANEVVGGSH